MTRLRTGKWAIVALAAVALGACDDSGQFAFPQLGGVAEEDAPINAGSTRLVERDVEAPEVFQVTEAGLWDGRPSLGGVWVAHPDADAPERVIIRNATNDMFVIGALFKRERENPGPRLQVSSDAAETLGMLAGAPVELNVTALRRKAVEDPVPATEAGAETGETVEALPDAPEISETPLDPIASAAAAIDRVDGEDAPQAAATPPPAPRPATSSLEKPFIQIGIFSVEDNASRTADRLRATGIVPTVLQQSSSGKTFWRVIVGPAQSRAERATLLASVKELGFADAYFVTN
jgi:cell division septation protein DedD